MSTYYTIVSDTPLDMDKLMTTPGLQLAEDDGDHVCMTDGQDCVWFHPWGAARFGQNVEDLILRAVSRHLGVLFIDEHEPDHRESVAEGKVYNCAPGETEEETTVKLERIALYRRTLAEVSLPRS
jgi:hypothetical protein